MRSKWVGVAMRVQKRAVREPGVPNNTSRQSATMQPRYGVNEIEAPAFVYETKTDGTVVLVCMK